MIKIRAKRNNTPFVELHIDPAESSMTFPGGRYITITKNLNELVDALLEVQKFMKEEPSSTQKWEIS